MISEGVMRSRCSFVKELLIGAASCSDNRDMGPTNEAALALTKKLRRLDLRYVGVLSVVGSMLFLLYSLYSDMLGSGQCLLSDRELPSGGRAFLSQIKPDSIGTGFSVDHEPASSLVT